MDMKGQSFIVFKMVIGAIFAVAVLGIVNQVLTNYASLGTSVTYQALKDGLQGSVSAKGVQTVRVKTLLFSQGMELGQNTLLKSSGLAEADFALDCNQEVFVCYDKHGNTIPDQGDLICRGAINGVDSCTAKQRVTAEAFICKIGRVYHVALNTDGICQ
ncbi:MAG: hypothetical protein GOV15_02590 [Candidatus Diapherotrites archaeon]|nr:hypothetical protein [Candidatus Diapherotrites archaeon]